MKPTDDMRRLAAELRQNADLRKTARRHKAAQIIKAATGLALLRQKLGTSNER